LPAFILDQDQILKQNRVQGNFKKFFDVANIFRWKTKNIFSIYNHTLSLFTFGVLSVSISQKKTNKKSYQSYYMMFCVVFQEDQSLFAGTTIASASLGRCFLLFGVFFRLRFFLSHIYRYKGNIVYPLSNVKNVEFCTDFKAKFYKIQ
jgi:hypothetical protein